MVRGRIFSGRTVRSGHPDILRHVIKGEKIFGRFVRGGRFHRFRLEEDSLEDS